MTGWNLPPGCSVSDIPGNRSIDEFIDRFCEKCEYEKCPVDNDVDKCPKHVLEAYDERHYPPEE